ncbi:hypothetical protein NX794_12865 [Streptomyces sp. LP11]|uniref:Lipoprotein n=1 Tax=Streptomyces pyxinicus TaxID=2970331 RepID=A0ABT2B0Q3_9ACTN|nr:hypothetical protein [Streptomyces sp. LP11]MCS0602092.1 hypothetical protein [Streptomyces sp. LP11]
MNCTARTRRRAAGTAVLALALGLGVTAQAAAGGPRTVSGKPADPITRVADFYGAYIDAQSDPDHGGRLAAELRAQYIDADYLKQLKKWEDGNHADGVLRAQNVPVAWKVTDNGTADHTEAGITLTWGGGETTKLVVDMTRGSHKILHIGTKGIDGTKGIEGK